MFGFGLITAPTSNSGTLEARGGLLGLGGSLTGNGVLQVDADSTLELSGASTEEATFAGVGATLKLDAPTTYAGTIDAFGPGDAIDLVGVAATDPVLNGSTLTVDLQSGGTLSYPVPGIAGTPILEARSDGGTGTDIVIFDAAQASNHSPEPVVMPNEHVGGTVTQAVTLTNASPANGAFENLDAAMGSPTAGITATGSFSGLAPGDTDSTDLLVGINTGAAGVETGTATITLFSDGTGLDGIGLTALPSQIVNVSGTVYREATGSITVPGTVYLHIPQPGTAGSIQPQSVEEFVFEPLTVTNTDPADGFSESLLATTGAGGTIEVAPGTSDATALGYAILLPKAGDTAGVNTGSVTVDLQSDGQGIDGLGITDLGTVSVPVSWDYINYATAAVEQTARRRHIYPNRHQHLHIELRHGRTGNGDANCRPGGAERRQPADRSDVRQLCVCRYGRIYQRWLWRVQWPRRRTGGYGAGGQPVHCPGGQLRGNRDHGGQRHQCGRLHGHAHSGHSDNLRFGCRNGKDPGLDRRQRHQRRQPGQLGRHDIRP